MTDDIAVADEDEVPAAPLYPILSSPADGVPDIVDTPAGYARMVAVLAAGNGPVSIDTERAHGFRYTAKAYLIQLRRAGSGTHLLDPIPLEAGSPRADLSELAATLGEAEWILHAASQDLPCLSEVRMLPRKLFDTELAARLLGIPKVNLNALMEQALGVTLLKEHSAADWSRRPLPEDWLSYAALDVERLDDLRLWLIDALEDAGKLEWATQEFAHLVAHAGDPVVPISDPWRRTSGLHDVHTGIGLAVVRQLWHARDAIAVADDRAPGRILNDRSITELAAKLERNPVVPTRAELRRIRGFAMRMAARHEATWLTAIETALALPKSELPPRHVEAVGPPQPRTWQNRWPESYARWARVRPALVARAEELVLPVENLMSPEIIRRLLWEAPASMDAVRLRERLTQLGARPWQQDQAIPVILAAWD